MGRCFMRCLGFVSVGLVGVVLSSTSAWPGFWQATEKQEANRTVTGHVFCEDTNAPARFARVMLEPVSDVSDAVAQEVRLHQRSARASAPGSQEPILTMPHPGKTNSVQAGLDGSFTMKGVKPGVYYVMAEMSGYLSPLAGLSVEGRQHPTASVADLMAKALERVTVEAGRTAVVNVGLERGAAVSGTVSFDDGSPAVGVRVKAQREKSDGNWETAELSAIDMFGSGITTNDLGQYRIAGLAAGHYVIEADLSLQNFAMTGFLGQFVGMEVRPQYSLSFFTGGYTRARADAALP